MQKETAAKTLKLLESGYSLPALSVVAVKLMELASDETSSINDMVELVEKDPALAVRILNLANSAFFSPCIRSATLSQAALRLGVNQLKIAALSLSLRNAFPMGKVGQLDYEHFWRVSLYRGLIAKALAYHSKAWNPEEAFIAGLTMEVGLPIFFDLYIRDRDFEIDLAIEPLNELLSRERDLFGIDHRQVGKAALKYWKFPDRIMACQDYNGNGEAALSPNSPVLSSLCELARTFARMLLDKSASFHGFFVAAEKRLGLGQEKINEIVLGTFNEVQDTAASFKLEMNSAKDLMTVIENANRALARISEKASKHAYDCCQQNLPSMDSLDNTETVTHTLQAIAHEIRNPLTVVGGFARRLVKSLDPESEVSKYAQVILAEALRLEKVFAGISEYHGRDLIRVTTPRFSLI